MNSNDEFESELEAEIAQMEAEDAERKRVNSPEKDSGSIIGDIIGTVVASAIGGAL